MRHVAVLDGGFAAWRAAGLPLETAARAPAPRALAGDAGRDAWVDSDSRR